MSAIVKKESESELLRKWVADSFGAFSPRLLYRGSKDGFSAATFHSRCDGKGPNLVVLLSIADSIFGGFTSLSWKSSEVETYEEDKSAFLYCLTKGIKCDKQKNDRSIGHNKAKGPIFGSLEGCGTDILIDDNATTGENYFSGDYTFALPEGAESTTFFTDSETYTLKDIEVFSISKP